jgi:hypothetical protein
MPRCYECDSRHGAFRDGLCDHCRVRQRKNEERDRQQEAQERKRDAREEREAREKEKLKAKLQAQEQVVNNLQLMLDELGALDKAKQKLDKDLEKAKRKVTRGMKAMPNQRGLAGGYAGSLLEPRNLDAKLEKAKQQVAELQAKLKENAAERRKKRSRAHLEKSLPVAKGKLKALVTAVQNMEECEGEAWLHIYDEDEDEEGKDEDVEDDSADDEEKEAWGYSDYNARDFTHDGGNI